MTKSMTNIGNLEAVLFDSNYTFDMSIDQLAVSILAGNQLVILQNKIQIGCNESYEYLNKNNVTYISVTPSQTQLIDFSQLNSLQVLTLAGEPFQKPQFEHVRKGFDRIIINAYGTTETTVYNLLETFLPEDEYISPIGKLLENTDFYVLDESGRPLPLGAIGELHIAGDCVGRGYLNRPEENAKRFILTEEENTDCRMFRTGDLVRWNYRGKLEYIGRIDKQVKFMN